FIFSRNACDEAAQTTVDAGIRLTTGPERDRIREIVDEHLDGLDDHDLAVLGYSKFLAALEAGVAAHHDPEDVARGAMELPGAQAPVRHPLTSVAIGISNSLLHPEEDLQELILSAVQMVRTAKLRSGNRVVVDRD
ncbi:MAG: hypothetical protein ACRDYV_17725, partial [Acidimicrobiia bacterium]